MPRRKTQAEQIAEREIKLAKAELGAGWNHISASLRQGLVMRNILLVVLGQDESIPADRVLEYARELTQAAQRILDEEENR